MTVPFTPERIAQLLSVAFDGEAAELRPALLGTLHEIERLSAERGEARATAQKWHKAAIDNTIGEEACKQFARETVQLPDSTWMRRAKDAETELSRLKAELVEAVGLLSGLIVGKDELALDRLCKAQARSKGNKERTKQRRL